ncbi:hypothetical protein Tsubulata_046912 [Turnera subulata]|uniref:Glycosyltransferase n=1 Tax=Turnera subulata TaxID=218843 RepID=A0A9Q0IZK6_9ROSI|nr:hypothetical protein Tsubulata_046912 [Turnera subulata]
MTSSGSDRRLHVALLPSAGMGHLTPFLRLAASLLNHGCQVTLITTHPIVSKAETTLISTFLATFPQVKELQFHVQPLGPSDANSTDPFFLQWEAIRRSIHLLSPLLSSLSPPPSALVADVSLISAVIPITTSLKLPHYILFTSSARMFSLFAYYPTVLSASSDASSPSGDSIAVPGGIPIPKSSIPPLLLKPGSLFASIFTEDGKKLKSLDGILINTFESLEPETLNAFKGGKVVDGLPNVYPLGLVPCDFEKRAGNTPLKWLEDQPTRSVVYVSFGSRFAVSREQIKEIGKGLMSSGSPFIWVVKDKKVDKDDGDSLDKILGDELVEKIKNKGLVVKEWVDQEQILGHKAVGGFVSHCGWNSVVEAAWHGVPLLAWPQFGDQKVNAHVIESSGLGLWPKSWGWAGEVVVKGEEVGARIEELMGSESLKLQAAHIREEARKAVVDGSCKDAMKQLLEMWKNDS